MPRMRILSATEQQLFDLPPKFDSVQRKQFFDFQIALRTVADDFRNPSSRIGFFVVGGYFKATKCFFAPSDFHQRDAEYIARQLALPEESFVPKNYTKTTRLRHEHLLLEFYGFKRFDTSTEKFISEEITNMARAQLKPKLIFWRCVDLLIRGKVQIPGYHRLTELILSALNQHQRELVALVKDVLTPEMKMLIDSLFVQAESGGDQPTKTTRYKLTLLKNLSQSTKPTKVREKANDLDYVAELYREMTPVLSAMNLNYEGIRYYAGSVIKAKIFQLNQRSDEDRYVHVAAFIAHQYYRLQDNLVDVVLSVVQSFQNSAQREHKEQSYEQQRVRNQSLSQLLSRLDGDVFDILRQINRLANDDGLNDTEKLNKIRALLQSRKEDGFTELKASLESGLNQGDYYGVLEERSLRLQNRVSPILKALTFQADASGVVLQQAIEHFQSKNGVINPEAPLAFLEPQEAKAILGGDDQKFRPSLYKAFLFMHTATGIKSGGLNFQHSYKYRPMDDYLISKEHWHCDKAILLERAGLTAFTDQHTVLKGLEKKLYEQYQTTNSNALKGKNLHLKFNENGSFRIATPALEEQENESLQQYFPEHRNVPLTEVLGTVNQHCGFLDDLQHWQQRHTRRAVSQRSLYAGVIGLGCGIGTRKMAQISSHITENELEHAVNWYFSLENVQAANDRIVAAMDQMELPNVYRRAQDQLHTSSDGQKFEVRTDSLNANYSFKYFGKEQGVSAYSFIDERSLLWHSLVFSAAERESAYVIDGLMHNDVVKSDIHSTDTHGYSEVIFAVTHPLGFSYAPRIKNLKKQSLYIFKSSKNKIPENWKITPDKYVSEEIITDNWDDFLRLVTTIKLKEATASDIFRRLNSYSKQHAIYKAMKAFGQIIKSVFILRYLDDLELRQAIEKQLNKIELANKFTRAVAVGNPREFTQGEKEEQEIAESCNRLIKNAIIHWNYLYLEQKLNGLETQEAKDRLLKAITSHSIATWGHFNFLGEYDFSDEKLQDSVGILPPKKPPNHR